MGNYHIGDGECRFRVVCSSPDVCEVGGYKVPFDSYQTLDSERQYSSTVWARGCRALNVGSVIAGTQSNAGKGVISGTSQGTGDCVILTGSPTVTIEGKPVAYHGSVVGINNHNCLGKLYTKIKSPMISVIDRTFNYERTAEVIHDLLLLKDLLSVGNIFDGDISPEVKNDLFQIKDPDQSWGEFFSIKNIRESLRNGIEGDKSQIREWFGENTLTQMGNGAITTLHGVADLALVTFDALLETATATVACPIGEDGLCEQAIINLNEKEQALFNISNSLINGQAWDALKKMIMDTNNGDQIALEHFASFLWGFMIPAKIPEENISGKVFVEPVVLEGGAGGNWTVFDEVLDSNVIKQLTLTGCGAACGEMLLRDRYIFVTQNVIGTELTSMTSLANKLNKFDVGWEGNAVSESSLYALSNTGSWGAMMWDSGSKVGHWVLVKGVDDAGNVIIYDPYQGSRYLMTEQEFKEVWNGHSVYKP
ncbi:DUF4150 domain-containing protein [Escherichia coli]|nr:DUF4150 domain-containing protein [Escherichia coli]HEA4436267.1 DUF4150 domain-containing protein [Escherichia coli]